MDGVSEGHDELTEKLIAALKNKRNLVTSKKPKFELFRDLRYL